MPWSLHRRAGATLLAVALGACGGSGEPPPRPASPPPAPAAAIVARTADGTVSADELDASLRLDLHDLDRARFELRAARLRELLTQRVLGPLAAAEGVSIEEHVRRHAAASGETAAAYVTAALERAGAEVLLAPPEPPVVEVSADDDAVRGPVDAPVTVVVFLDYQSPYCRRMQPLFRRLLAEYPRHVRLVARDFPLPVHRDAVRAAEAAECAGAQDAYWPYHDVLLQDGEDLGRLALGRAAERIGLDGARFAACVDARRTRAEVEADATEARRLGLRVVPTTFVNGRYLRGPQPYEALRAAVAAELARLGVEAPAPRPVEAPESPRPTAPPTTVPAAPSVTLTLPAAQVRRALARRGRLARDLERPQHDLGPGWEGRRLVRVQRVRPGSLYALMGLQPGDVLATVNGAVVLDDGDALFDALRDRPTVTVQVIRRGLPRTFEYRIE
jgi:protein-disulfide isomerase